jgi:CDP-glucose 4,6-dehydratase
VTGGDDVSKEFWQGRSVLVTGATGLLGSWMVPALVHQGASVVALVRDGAPGSKLVSEGWLNRVATVRGALTDGELLRRTMAEYAVETVFHLGAQTLVGVAKSDPIGTFEANIRGTWLLLEAARQCKVQQVIVASSDKAYGDSDRLPYREDHPLRGRFPYEVSKSCTDLITAAYAHTYGTSTAIVRCGNLFGGGDLNFSRLIPGVIASTLRGQNFVIRSDGLYVRDFLYVEDAVDAYLTLAQRLHAEPALAGEAFNFGLELRLTMLDLVHKVLGMMGRPDLQPVIQNVAQTEIREQYLDADKARQRLQWRPGVGMDEGLKRTIEWYSAFLAPTPSA